MSLSRGERSRYFDSYVAAVDTALRHPEIVQKLGDLASSIIQVNASAFLPNERHGKMRVPKEYKDDFDRLALIPMASEDADRATGIVAPILNRRGPWKKLEGQVTSSVSGASLGAAAMINWLERDTEETQPDYPQPKGLATSSGARSMVCFTIGDGKDGSQYYSASRPVAVVRANILDGLDQWNQAAMIGHEEVHVLDIINNPVLYKMPMGRAGSELVAYRVTNALHAMTSQSAPGREFAQEVEDWRLRNVGPSEYAPQEDQLAQLSGWIID